MQIKFQDTKGRRRKTRKEGEENACTKHVGKNVNKIYDYISMYKTNFA